MMGLSIGATSLWALVIIAVVVLGLGVLYVKLNK